MPSPINKLILSVAGSGKTTYLVREAIKIEDKPVLITTYTEANEIEIRNKFYKLNGFIPANVTIQTWFSFLLQHGIRPYQGSTFEWETKGMILVNGPSGIAYKNRLGIAVQFSEEKDFKKHYFTSSGKVYSDKLSKLVIRCNKDSNGMVLRRISRIYPNIFIDEVQDLAGNDLELIKLFFKAEIRTILVGDPRQVTYLTHHEKKNSKYKDGDIKHYILDNCSKHCLIDEDTLRFSHRNNLEICNFSSRLYPQFSKSEPCNCTSCREVIFEHSGIYLVRNEDVKNYERMYRPTVLRHQLAVAPEWNFGACKGLGFDRVLIYPTEPINKYLTDGILIKTEAQKVGQSKTQKKAFDIAKFYVAVTRARHSVAIVYDYTNENFIEGIMKWSVD